MLFAQGARHARTAPGGDESSLGIKLNITREKREESDDKEEEERRKKQDWMVNQMGSHKPSEDDD